MSGRFAHHPTKAPTDSISVLVVDDDEHVRQRLVDALTGSDNIKVVGEADDGGSGIAAVEAEAPDLVLMDVDMPVMDGVRAAWRLSRTRPDLPVVLMSVNPSDELVLLALRAGAAGVLSKALDADALQRVLRGVADDEGAISRSTSRSLGEELHRRRASASEQRPIESPLTTREWQILRLLQRGITTTEMSRQLFLSVHTIRSHVKRMLAKLDVHSRAEAVAWAEQLPDSGSAPADDELDAAGEEQSLEQALAELLHPAT